MQVVTGAFGYIGREIARQLLAQGHAVRTVTTHPEKPDPFDGEVEARPYDFDNPERLVGHLRGAEVLFNTYWIRFAHGGATFAQANQNTRTLLAAARQAGVHKVVHISVTHPDLASELPYYRGKARQEMDVAGCGLPFAIVRPTLVFGRGDILVNNIAWLLRRFPVFPIFGGGAYRLQPVHVADLGRIAIRAAGASGDAVWDAAGPEILAFKGMVQMIRDRVSPRTWLVRSPPWLGLALGRLIGLLLGDVILTRAELDGLRQEKLVSNQPPLGTTLFSDWLAANATVLGRRYASEVARHFAWQPDEPPGAVLAEPEEGD